ncbi:MAG: ThiF family adenylyltransferase [Elusimicrobia bacterium]|nr:ThiF family adenylyltransferase [Elusimicrobiota bacterium]
MDELNRDELSLYSRQLMIPELGLSGQRKLKASKALLIGAGGLGSPCANYLARAGIGTIGLVDGDNVDASNLHRQTLFEHGDIGKPKLEVAKKRLESINPHIKVNVHAGLFDAQNALPIASGYDILIDGTDNFPSRYLINDVAVALGKPNVWASVFQFEGRLSVFDASRGPCYRCLYPEAPPEGAAPNCAQSGVLGVLPGIMGTMQALEVIKLAAGVGRPLLGALLHFDALTMKWREFRITKSKNCVCSGRGILNKLDRIPGCSGEKHRSGGEEINPHELKEKLEQRERFVLLDVREDAEWALGHLPDALHIPLGQLADRIKEIDGDKEIVVYCRSGSRSAYAVTLLKSLGITNVRNLKGGFAVLPI